MRWMIILILAFACAHHKRTPYKSLQKGEGFSDTNFEDDLQMASFKANAKTKTSQASMFARFRAMDICRSSGMSLTHIMEILDKTQSEKVMRISSTGYPAYYFGMSPYYQRYSGFGFGFSTMSSQTWNETLIYPNFEVIYRCSEKILEPRLGLVEVPPADLRHLVKDLSGAILVQKILPDSPNKNFIRPGDIIIKIEGNRVQKIYELLNAFHKKSELNVDLLRDGELKKSIKLFSADISDTVKKDEEELLKDACTYEDLKDKIPCRK